MATSTDLAAGPALDRAVAEALGWEYAGYCRRGPVYKVGPEGRNCFPSREIGVDFCPSTDWNDAMLAAERFSGFDLWRLNKTEHGYYMACLCHGDDGWSAFTTCDTGPLAVCSAIILIGR